MPPPHLLSIRAATVSERFSLQHPYRRGSVLPARSAPQGGRREQPYPSGELANTMIDEKNQSDVPMGPIRTSASILPVPLSTSLRTQRRKDRPNANRRITFSSLIRVESSADATIARDEALVRTALRVECSIWLRFEIFRWRRKLRVFYNSYC